MRKYSIFLRASLKAPLVKAVSIISLLFLLFLPYYIAFYSVEHKSMSLFKTYFSFPLVFNSTAIFQFYPSILVGTVVVLIVTKAFEDGVFKIFLINGYTRRRIWTNSLLSCLLVSVLLFLITAAIAFHIGYLKTGEIGGFGFNDFKWVVIYFFQTFMILLFALSTALLVKHSGSAVFVYLVYLLLAERLLAQFMDFVLDLYPMFRFLPGKVIEDLTYLDPNTNFVIQYLDVQDERWLASIVWLIISLIGTYILFKKANYSR